MEGIARGVRLQVGLLPHQQPLGRLLTSPPPPFYSPCRPACFWGPMHVTRRGAGGKASCTGIHGEGKAFCLLLGKPNWVSHPRTNHTRPLRPPQSPPPHTHPTAPCRPAPLTSTTMPVMVVPASLTMGRLSCHEGCLVSVGKGTGKGIPCGVSRGRAGPGWRRHRTGQCVCPSLGRGQEGSGVGGCKHGEHGDWLLPSAAAA